MRVRQKALQPPAYGFNTHTSHTIASILTIQESSLIDCLIEWTTTVKLLECFDEERGLCTLRFGASTSNTTIPVAATALLVWPHNSNRVANFDKLSAQGSY